MMPRRQPLRRTELKRSTPLRQGKPLARNTPLRNGPVKPRRTNSTPDSVAPSSPGANSGWPVKARSESTRIPEPIRLAVLERDGYCCMRCGRYLVDGIRYGLQHRRPRGRGGSTLLHTMANLVTLCGWTVDPGTCTEAVELLDRERAAAEGWLLPRKFRLIEPEFWPVLRWDGHWAQPGDGWTSCEPHPRQVEMLGEAA
jgi:5-methylcytosine-specific restriction endonuclease McrA